MASKAAHQQAVIAKISSIITPLSDEDKWVCAARGLRGTPLGMDDGNALVVRISAPRPN